MSKDNPKVLLIKEVNRVCSVYDDMAHSCAVVAVRNSDDKKAMDDARRYIAMADSLSQARQAIVDAIHRYWPEAEAGQ